MNSKVAFSVAVLLTLYPSSFGQGTMNVLPFPNQNETSVDIGDVREVSFMVLQPDNLLLTIDLMINYSDREPEWHTRRTHDEIARLYTEPYVYSVFEVRGERIHLANNSTLFRIVMKNDDTAVNIISTAVTLNVYIVNTNTGELDEFPFTHRFIFKKEVLGTETTPCNTNSPSATPPAMFTPEDNNHLQSATPPTTSTPEDDNHSPLATPPATSTTEDNNGPTSGKPPGSTTATDANHSRSAMPPATFTTENTDPLTSATPPPATSTAQSCVPPEIERAVGAIIEESSSNTSHQLYGLIAIEIVQMVCTIAATLVVSLVVLCTAKKCCCRDRLDERINKAVKAALDANFILKENAWSEGNEL